MPDPDPTRQDTPPARAALHLADAAELLGRHLPDWPPTFRPRELAALLAGGWRKEAAAAYRRWQRRIDDGIARGLLIAEPAAALRKPPAGERWVYEAIALAKESVALRARAGITRAAAARWLREIDEEPSAVARAWIGAEWRPLADRKYPSPAQEDSKAFAKAGAAARHHENRAIKDDIQRWYSDHRCEFDSYEAAANAADKARYWPVKRSTILRHIQSIGAKLNSEQQR